MPISFAEPLLPPNGEARLFSARELTPPPARLQNHQAPRTNRPNGVFLADEEPFPGSRRSLTFPDSALLRLT